jgi:hypothetical protein
MDSLAKMAAIDRDVRTTNTLGNTMHSVDLMNVEKLKNLIALYRTFE